MPSSHCYLIATMEPVCNLLDRMLTCVNHPAFQFVPHGRVHIDFFTFVAIKTRLHSKIIADTQGKRMAKTSSLCFHGAHNATFATKVELLLNHCLMQGKVMALQSRLPMKVGDLRPCAAQQLQAKYK